ncbi:MAG: amidohydrolase [Deltaproteobacteria bacterium]|jgi:predicted amidohydrolase YtcJ|nr:amidohydrolase [Deltaproteobacteria bacterium]
MTVQFDQIIYGNFITMDLQQPRAEAVGIKDGRIARVGFRSDFEQSEKSGIHYLDLSGNTILPGFFDTHVHANLTGGALQAVNLTKVNSIGETLALVKTRVDKTQAGKVISCFGFDRINVQEKRLPTIQELDQISRDHVIVIYYFDLHGAILNSRAFQMFNFSQENDGVEFGTDNQPTGFIGDPSFDIVQKEFGEGSDLQTGLNNIIMAAKEGIRNGLTTLHIKEPPELIKFVQEHRDLIPVRFLPMVRLTDISIETIDSVINSGVLSQGGFLAVLADGALDCHSAALFEPYSNKDDALGMLFFNNQELENFIKYAHQKGLRVSIHADGDRSTEQVVAAFETALEHEDITPYRHRIEHLELMNLNQMHRTAAMGLTLAMQPMFLANENGDGNLESYEILLGKKRCRLVNALRSILDTGNLISGGSDGPITPLSPMAGIHICVNHPNQDQATDLYEAISIFTLNAAKASFESDTKGSIEVGKLADFTVLSRDPFLTPKVELKNIETVMTVIDGKIVFDQRF